MESRVGELSLTIRARGRARPGTSTDAECFATRVLARCDALLEARAPGRVIRMRALAMRWRLRAGALASEVEVDAVAREIAESIDMRASGARGAEDADDLVVFADESRWGAAVLRATARSGAAPWWASPLVDGALPGLLGDPRHRATTSAILARLAAEGDIVAVLATLPENAGRAIAAALSLDTLLGDAPGPYGLARDGSMGSHADGIARALDELPPALARATLVLAAHGLLAHLLATTDPPLEALARVVALHAARRASRPSLPAPRSSTGRDPAAGFPEEAPTVDRDGAPLFATRAAGLVYLVRPTLELDVGETLWRACLDERAVLARAWRQLASAADPTLAEDPAIALLAGAPATAVPGVLDEPLRAEIAISLLRALGTSLPRQGRGLAALRLALAHGAAGRTLVGWLDGMPVPAFAWNAPGLAELRAGVRAAVAAWPDAGVVRAPPALAALAPGGRVAPLPRRAGEREHAALSEIAAATEDVEVLVRQVGGVVATLVAWRAGWGESSVSGALARAIAHPGLVAVAGETLTVTMPMSAIDLVLRRASLDRDPGWVPWLRRSVRIAFEDDALDVHR